MTLSICRAAAWLEYALSIPARTGTALAVDENGTVYVAAGESLIVVDAGGCRLIPWVGGVSAMTLGALLYASVSGGVRVYSLPALELVDTLGGPSADRLAAMDGTNLAAVAGGGLYFYVGGEWSDVVGSGVGGLAYERGVLYWTTNAVSFYRLSEGAPFVGLSRAADSGDSMRDTRRLEALLRHAERAGVRGLHAARACGGGRREYLDLRKYERQLDAGGLRRLRCVSRGLASRLPCWASLWTWP